MRAKGARLKMSNKQKNKSTENRQGQNQSARQEIPDYGTKSQNKNPEMENKGCPHNGRG